MHLLELQFNLNRSSNSHTNNIMIGPLKNLTVRLNVDTVNQRQKTFDRRPKTAAEDGRDIK